MPYTNEYANPLGHLEIASSKYIKERLTTFARESIFEKIDLFENIPVIAASELPPGREITHAVAIDGSLSTLELEHNAEVSFIKVGIVFDNLKAHSYAPEALVNPELVEKAYSIFTLETVLPGAGICDKGDPKVYGRNKFRNELWSSFKNLNINRGKRDKAGNPLPEKTVLELYRELARNEKVKVRCPNPECRKDTLVGAVPIRCSFCGEERLYMTDELAFHTRFNDNGGNSSLFAEVMSVIERLAMVGFINRASENKKALESALFITDGPLALFTKNELPARLLAHYQANSEVALVGFEKTGGIVNFTKDQGFQKFLQAGELAMLTDDIYRAILGKEQRDSKTASTMTNFYGRYFIYKTLDSERYYVFSVPPRDGLPYGGIDSADDWSDYPHLATIVNYIEDNSVLLFGQDVAALATVSKANEAASIPKRLGGLVLEELSEHSIENI